MPTPWRARALRGGPLRMLGAFVATALLGPWGSGVSAQEINPDRPDLTTSAEIVPAGALQIEAGFEYERARVGGGPAERQATVQAVLRAGLTSRLEVSVEGEPFVWRRSEREDQGSGDYTLGLKYRFFAPGPGPAAAAPAPDEAGPALAVKPFVKLPTASAPIGSERPDFGALLLMTLGLPWGLSLDANAGVAAIGQTRPNGSIPQGIVSGSLSWAATERLSTITELFFATRDERDGRASLRATIALMYKVTSWLALDAGVRTTLAGPGPDWAALAGLSVRLGR